MPVPGKSVERGGSGEEVVLRGKRWGHAGLQIESRRGGGEWEEVGILATRGYRDTRPLLVAGQPEVREYRGRFWDGSEEISGEWSAVGTVTVSV